MSCPHVAGAAALNLQVNPNLTPADLGSLMKFQACKNKISNINNSPNELLHIGASATFDNYFMETFVVENINSTQWKRVNFLESYTSPVAVCSVRYEGSSMVPTIVRMQKVQSDSFELRLQNPSGTNTGSNSVHCIVVEEGSWTMSDGRQIEAKKYTSTRTDRKGSWVGEQQSYTATFNQPVVVGQVMSFFDPDWSVFWCRGSSIKNPPSSSSLYTGMHVGEDSDTTRISETIGYIVIEEGEGTTGSPGIQYEAKVGADSVRGYQDSPAFSYSYNTPFSKPPMVTIVTQAAMDGGDGSWAVTSYSQTASLLKVVVDEDQIGQSERKHTTEQVAYLALSADGSMRLS